MADRGQSLAALAAQPGRPLYAHQAALTTLIAAARAIATSDDESLAHRLVAVDVLGRLDVTAGKILIELLDARHVQELQSAAADAIGRADSATAEAMFATWPTRTITTRRALVTAALRSKAATTALVAAIEQEHVRAKELDPGVRDALRAVRDSELAPRIKQALEFEGATDRAAIVARYEPALKRAGDRTRGAAVFEKHCLACHHVQGRGHRVGPELSGIASRAKEVLLVDLFDPGRQVSPDFIAYTLLTREGQVLTGLLVSETATSVTLRRSEGAQDFVLRSQIEELRGTGKSLMPDGMEQNLSEEDVADLLEFLARPDARLFSAVK